MSECAGVVPPAILHAQQDDMDIQAPTKKQKLSEDGSPTRSSPKRKARDGGEPEPQKKSPKFPKPRPKIPLTRHIPKILHPYVRWL